MALDAVSVTDTMVEDVICASGPLEPGGSLVCTGSYTITQADLDAGSVTNIAQGHGTYGGGEAVASDEASLTITALAPEPAALTLEMGADPTTFSAVDEVIVYAYLLTNTGGVALDAVTVTDTMVEDVLCASGPLEPGESLVCTGSYTITQADLDAGSVTNIAQGHGTYGEGEAVASDEVSLTITARRHGRGTGLTRPEGAPRPVDDRTSACRAASRGACYGSYSLSTDRLPIGGWRRCRRDERLPRSVPARAAWTDSPTPDVAADAGRCSTAA